MAEKGQNELKRPKAYEDFHQAKITKYMGSGCGSVGRVVASVTRDPRFKSWHRHIFTSQLINRKDENKEKGSGNGPSLKRDNKTCHMCFSIYRCNVVLHKLVNDGHFTSFHCDRSSSRRFDARCSGAISEIGRFRYQLVSQISDLKTSASLSPPSQAYSKFRC